VLPPVDDRDRPGELRRELLALVLVALVLTGSLAVAIGDAIGVGRGTVDVWNVAKWPALMLIVMTMFALLYYLAPNVRQPRFRWITPGAIVGMRAAPGAAAQASATKATRMTAR